MTTIQTSLLRAALPAFALLVVVFLTVLLARSTAAAAPPATGDWQLPLPGSPHVLRPFDPPAEKWSAGHRGVDLSAAVGTAVLAAGSGVVAYSGRVAGRGVVSVEHGELRTTYQPVRPSVRAGQRVDAGQPIGTVVADPHCGARGCLHWGLLRGDRYLDPMTLLRGTAPRLLPVWGIPSGAAISARPTGSPSWQRASPRPARAAPPASASSPTSAHAHGEDSGNRSFGAWGALAATTGATAVGVAVTRRSRRQQLIDGGPP